MNDTLDHVIAIAREAGALVRSAQGRVERLTKGANDEAVTVADRDSQRLIVDRLRARFPEDGIIGEESDDGKGITNLGGGARCWVIDPIDGTNNFVAGLGNVAVCIARMEAGMPVLGVVYDVFRDEVYAAAAGHGAWYRGSRTFAPQTPISERSLVMLTSNLIDPEGRLPGYVGRWFHQAPFKIRILGSAALEAVAVGAGLAHAALTVNGKLWDIAAAAAIVLESGGVVVDPQSGAPVFPYDLRGYAGAKVPFLAGGPIAQAQMLADMRGA